jgi:hypothetical protein
LRDPEGAGDFEFRILNWGGIAHAKAAKDAKDGREPRPSRGATGV